MKLKAKVKYYLMFALIFLFGASFAAGLFFSYRLTILTPLAAPASEGLSFDGYALMAAAMLRPLILLALAAFTIYACAVCALSTLTAGMLSGQFLMSYCLSAHSPFTHAAVLLIALAFGTVYTILSTQTALYRSTLRAVAPDPVALIKKDNTRALLRLLLLGAAVLIAFSLAAYFLAVFFPLTYTYESTLFS